MKYLLIDTCSWIKLLSINEENPLLERLNFWIKNKAVHIIVPEIIITEWGDHKEKQKKILYEHWTTMRKHSEIYTKKLGTPFIDIEFNFDFIDKQFDIIDSILESSCHKIKVSDKIKAIISDKTLAPRKAPFHNNINSTKDAYIYFSTLEYCDYNKITELYFISENTKEFGEVLITSTTKEPKGNLRKIHPDLLRDFPEISVEYYGDIGWFISDLTAELPQFSDSRLLDITEVQNYNIFNIDKTKPILEQLYEYVGKIHSEISFFPLHILINQYPFKESRESYPRYSSYSIYTGNSEMISLFEATSYTKNKEITIRDKKFYNNISDWEKKIREVTLSFIRNGIFYIYDMKYNKRIPILPSNRELCKCPDCEFDRLNFVDSFMLLDKLKSNDIANLKKAGYLHYKIGNYIKSAQYFTKVSDISKKDKQKISFFISQYNLLNLKAFSRNYYCENSNQEDIIDLPKNIDLFIDILHANIENKDIFEWIIQDKYYSSYLHSITVNASTVIDHYYRQINGGWSSNNDVYYLISRYAEIVAFLGENKIIFDHFSNFYNLNKIVFEALFASHAITHPSASRLEYFDDWLMIRILNYGSARDINKFYFRYKLKKIHYRKSSKEGRCFTDLISNFFSNIASLEKSFQKIAEKNNFFFWQYYSDVFCNIVTLVSICNFEKSFINKFANQLIEYLENETFLNHSVYEYINIFFQRVGRNLNTIIINKYLALIISRSQYHSEEFFMTIDSIIISSKKALLITKEQFDNIIEVTYDKCSECNRKHSKNIIVYLYRIIKNNNYKREIVKKIKNELERSFDFELFYLATILDVIDYSPSYFQKALEESYPKNKHSFLSMYTGTSENRFFKLNKVINLYFKYGIPTNTDEFEKIKLLDDYYHWLLDMDNFDYKKFQALWIDEYRTHYYCAKIANNMKTKYAVESYLKDNNDPRVEKSYLRIFALKTWEK